MKKYIIGLLLFATITSCIKVDNSESTKMNFYSEICYNISRDITSYSELLYAAKRADEWQIADSDEKKYEIEDTYFDSYKIRKSNDTITVLKMCHFITQGKRLNDENAVWEVITSKDTILIERKNRDIWTMRGNNGNHLFDLEFTYSLRSINEIENCYTVKGNYQYKTSNNFNIEYEVSQELTMNHRNLPCRYSYTKESFSFNERIIERIIEGGEINCTFRDYDKTIRIDYNTPNKILFKYDNEWMDIPFYSSSTLKR